MCANAGQVLARTSETYLVGERLVVAHNYATALCVIFRCNGSQVLEGPIAERREGRSRGVWKGRVE